MKRFLISFIIILLCFTAVHAQESKKEYGLAVLDLQANSVSESEALALSEMLRSSITQTINEKSEKLQALYNLIERSQMDKIFEQFDIQNTGCTDMECAIEFGKMLNADRIIIGSVSLVGSTYMVIARIVDVESSKALVSVDRRVRGVIDNVIDLMPLVGHELLTGERLAAPVPAAPLSVAPVITAPAADVPQKVERPKEQYLSASDISLTFVSIPGGTFRMGDIQGGGYSNESPVHTVTVSGFEMSATEVTVGQFRKFIEETDYLTEEERSDGAYVYDNGK